MKKVLGQRSESNREHIDELLSAYLDGMLEPQERGWLEARLRRDPELRKQLDGLRLTVRALAGLPKVEPPRNFILSPVMVRDKKPERPKRKSRTWPVFGWATAVAALLFALVFGGDMFVVSPTVRNEPTNIVAQAPASEEARLEPQAGEGESAPAVAQETEGPVLAQEAPKEAAPTPEGLRAAAPEAPAATAAPEAASEAQVVTEPAEDRVTEATEEAAPAAAASMPAGGGGVTPTAAATPMIEAAEAAPVEGPEAEASAAEEAPQAEVTATQPMPMLQRAPETAMAPSPQAVAAVRVEEAAEASEAESTAEGLLSWLRLAEVGLGLSAVVLLAVTLVLRWRRV